jgi:hydroxyacylglutathione hydrolase
MKIERFVFNPFQENTYVVSEGNSCVFVDPGCSNATEEQALSNYVTKEGLKPEAIWSTHSHIDHIMGNAYVAKKWNIPIFIHEEDQATLNQGEQVARMYGLDYVKSPEPSGYFNMEKQLVLGETSFEIRFAPGHAPGHVVFVNHEHQFVLGGDVLFKRSIGRTDLPGGNANQLYTSIREKLYVLPDEYLVLSGHGPDTTIGEEKRLNPFVQGAI